MAAFVPGSARPLTLEPGAAVQVEVRPASAGVALEGSTDTLFIPVQGSCEMEHLEVPLVVSSDLEACNCEVAPPGIKASAINTEYSCAPKTTVDMTVFNGSLKQLTVTGVFRNDANGDAVPLANALPLKIASGESAVLNLLPPKALDGLGVTGSTRKEQFKALLATSLGTVLADVRWGVRGANLALNLKSSGVAAPGTLPFESCAPIELVLKNLGTEPAVVAPATATRGLSVSGFATAQTILPGKEWVFSVSPVSNPANDCATTGNLQLAIDGVCAKTALFRGSTYSGPCTCNGF